MLRNYFKIAWRNLKKNKVFSFINIFGLAVGLTCCMLISLYLYHEFSYDNYHKNGNRIYQLGTNFMEEGEEEKQANTSGPLGRMLQQDFPEIEASARVMRLWRDDKTLFQVKEGSSQARSFYESSGYLADSSLFQVLTFPFKEGNPKTALLEPLAVVLSEDIADRLFGNRPALGNVVHISSSTNGDHDFKVTGVYKAPPSPSHFDARFIMSFGGGDMNGFANDNPSPVNNNMFFTYLLLKEGAKATQLEAKFPAFINTHMGAELKAMGKQRNYFLTPVREVHLSGIKDNVTPGGNKTSLFILASIAVLTLLIACINFMNLSTSSSAKRAAEVGVRKVLGAEKASLLRQFLGESVLMAGIALLVAVLFTLLLLPLFEQVSGRNLALSFGRHAVLLLFFIGAGCCYRFAGGQLSGVLPFFVQADQRTERKVFQFTCGRFLTQRAGGFSIRHIGGAYCCLVCYCKANEVSALAGPGFYKGSAGCYSPAYRNGQGIDTGVQERSGFQSSHRFCRCFHVVSRHLPSAGLEHV
jgi:putative ABC transport system permease protein